MLRKVCLLSIGSTLLAGCFGTHTSQAPIATTYPISEQQKMQAAHHWDVLAQHQADLLTQNERLKNQPLFIKSPDQTTPFSRAFDTLLTSQLVAKGAYVKTSPTQAALVSYKVQVVEHKDRGYIRAPEGAMTALAAGIAVATIPYNNWAEPALALIPAAAATDLFSGSWTSETDQEVVITTQVTMADQVVYSNSNIYYINPGDNGHYSPASEGAKLKSMNVSGEW
ncbi:hypothetical protein [Marinobacterium sediminicola]|uniref:Lipoprotein n=1 Tax=Marinobacterium sediminicola TaxID=518898 RepID=A0ABY1S426_9GAMM|nr:hypothetical protein [Marinobacterium sediminicola]ULG69870.1 hypothetical protein LN244_03400 [Marinobacterium sediminicola]SMR77850.1 hypothetical protein SAMN04487964_11840 [Marinobacterium sediminicola]